MRQEYLAASRLVINENMDHVIRSFFAMRSAKNIDWTGLLESWKNFSWEDQEQLMACTLRSELAKLCPPSLQFRKNFLKFILNQLESAGAEVCDGLYEEYGELISICDAAEGNLCYKSYFMPSGDHVTLQESIQLITQGTTGLRTWPAAQYLAEWALENREKLQGKSILELGSGLGLTGLVVRSQCYPASYTFSDCHGAVLAQLAANIHRNQRLLQQQCTCQRDDVDTGGRVHPDAHCVPQQSGDTEHSNPDKQQTSDSKQNPGAQIANQTIKSPPCQKCAMHHICTPLNGTLQTVQQSHHESSSQTENKPSIRSTNCLPMDSSCGDEEQSGFCSNCWQRRQGGSDSVETWQLSADSQTRLAMLHWDEVSEEDLQNTFSDVQIILAADVAYDNCNFPALVRVLKCLLQPSHGHSERIAYIANRVRNEDTIQEFLTTLDSFGLSHIEEGGPKASCFLYDQSVPIILIRITASAEV